MVLIIILGCWLASGPTAGADDWKSTLQPALDRMLENLPTKRNIFIEVPTDATRERAYYPFATMVQSALISVVLRTGHKIVRNPLDASYYLRTGFTVTDKGMLLTPTLAEAVTGALTATVVVELPAKSLPASWSERTLRDIAYELATKLARSRQLLFHSQLPVVVEELIGGKTRDDDFVSEFAIAMRGYIREELGRFGNLRPLTTAASQDEDTQPYRLTGHYQVSGSHVILRLVLLSAEGDFEVANVSSRFATALIPSSLPVLPPNALVARNTGDSVSSNSGKSTGADNVGADGKEQFDSENKLAVWVNKEDRVYFDNDLLVIYLKTAIDLYAKVYYVQSDGAICEIFPIRGSDGFLKAGEVRTIGDINDNVELTISDQTTGQEVIKVFTSSEPIDDSNLPKEFIGGPNVFCLEGDYESLTQGLTRALKKKARVRPSAELKILVSQR